MAVCTPRRARVVNVVHADGEQGMTEARRSATVRMAPQAGIGIVQVAGDVRAADRHAERVVLVNDAVWASGQMAGVAARLGEVEFAVLPVRIDELGRMTLVARGEVAAARRVDVEDGRGRSRRPVHGDEAQRPRIVRMTLEALRRSAIARTDGARA